LARSNLELQIARFPVLRYGLAVLSVSVALGGSLLLERFHFRNVADPLFLFAIAIAVWYAGIGPAILAVVLSGLSGITKRYGLPVCPRPERALSCAYLPCCSNPGRHRRDRAARKPLRETRRPPLPSESSRSGPAGHRHLGGRPLLAV
jgi:hypothetical protein